MLLKPTTNWTTKASRFDWLLAQSDRADFMAHLGAKVLIATAAPLVGLAGVSTDLHISWAPVLREELSSPLTFHVGVPVIGI